MDLTTPAASRVVEAVRSLDPDVASFIEARWAEHAVADAPLLAVFGPAKAGKTALVARLLIEAGEPVPDWLTMGARPEETSGTTVHCHGWEVLDLPGIGAEQLRHDETAWDGLELVDAVLLVMPPSLLTGDGLGALELVDGSWYHAHGKPLAWPPGALRLVIAQADSANADPEEDPEELEELKEDLVPAIDAMLASVGGRGGATLWWTVASPSGILNHTADPTRATFDRSRQWDGIDAMVEELRRTAATVQELRVGALRRFLHRSARVVREAGARDLARLQADCDQACLVEQQRALVDTQMDAFIDSARARLRAVVLECFSAMLDSAPAPGQALPTLQAEFANHQEAFERRLAADTEQLIAQLRELVAELPVIELDPGGPAVARTGRRKRGVSVDVDELSSGINGVVRSGVEFRLGESIAEVKHKLRTLEKLDGEKLDAALKEAGGFKDARVMKEARDLVKVAEKVGLVLEALPAVVRLGSEIGRLIGNWQEQRRTEALVADRDRLVDALVEALMDAPDDGYATRIKLMRSVIVDALGDPVGLVSALEGARDDLTAHLAELDEALIGLDESGTKA